VWSNLYSKLGSDLIPSPLTELMGFITSDVISFAGGLPHPKSFPVSEVQSVLEEIMRDQSAVALQYGSTQGYKPLIQWIANRSSDKGLPAGPENIIITSGSQQALDLISRILLDPDDEILVESPTYLGALGPFANQYAKFTEIPMDQDGVDTEAIERILKDRAKEGKKVKFIYLIPTFQNPTGVTLSIKRRQEMARLAHEYNVFVIEDDPYSELRYEGNPVPTIKSFDATGHVIYLSTFSKILSPGVRMGWIVAHPEIINKLTYLKESVDLHSSTLIQLLVYEYCRKGYLEPHIRSILPLYASRREAMLNALIKYAPDNVTWTTPDGGFFLWVTFPPHIDTKKLFPTAASRGVAYVPGYAFYPDGKGLNSVRLSFSLADEDQIDEGIRILMEVVQEQ